MRPEVEREGVHHFEWGQRPERWPHVSHMFLGVTQLAVSSFPCHHDSRSNPPPARGGQANESTQV